MDLILVGAGTFGREAYTWLSQTIKKTPEYKIKGFIDNFTQNQSKLIENDYPVKLLGTIDDYRPKPEEKLVMSIFNPEVKKKYVELLLQRGSKFHTLIHPSIIIGHNVKIGEGCVICPNCILANDSKICDFVFINTNSTVGHDTIIGDFTSINGKVEITGDVKVGSECFFGVGAVVINGLSIGDRTIVGAGSVVIRNFGSDVTVFGNPAKKIKGNKSLTND
jgi:sugar O-acyltransferase (sialic acid O-acetyltransferase NeuD family)